jgi:hypothetical protein
VLLIPPTLNLVDLPSLVLSLSRCQHGACFPAGFRSAILLSTILTPVQTAALYGPCARCTTAAIAMPPPRTSRTGATLPTCIYLAEPSRTSIRSGNSMKSRFVMSLCVSDTQTLRPRMTRGFPTRDTDLSVMAWKQPPECEHSILRSPPAPSHSMARGTSRKYSPPCWGPSPKSKSPNIAPSIPASCTGVQRTCPLNKRTIWVWMKMQNHSSILGHGIQIHTVGPTSQGWRCIA